MLQIPGARVFQPVDEHGQECPCPFPNAKFQIPCLNLRAQLDDVLKGSDTTSPFSLGVTGVAVGSHTLKAVAWDSTSLCTTSAVAIASPEAGSTVRCGADGTFVVRADDGSTGSEAGKSYGFDGIMLRETPRPASQGTRIVVD